MEQWPYRVFIADKAFSLFFFILIND